MILYFDGDLTMAKKASGGGGLETLSTDQLQAEIRRRERGASKLLRKRDKLAAKLAELNAQIAAAGVAVGGRGGRRVSGASLADIMAKVMSGKTMSVSEIADAVLRNGYASSSPNLKSMVSQKLGADKKRFKRVERGQYTAG